MVSTKQQVLDRSSRKWPEDVDRQRCANWKLIQEGNCGSEKKFEAELKRILDASDKATRGVLTAQQKAVPRLSVE